MEKRILPNATATLILGIASLVFGCFFVGLLFGIIGLAISGKSKKAYLQNPDIYEGYAQLNAGRIMSVIGIVLGGLAIVWYLVAVLIFDAFMPWELFEELFYF